MVYSRIKCAWWNEAAEATSVPPTISYCGKLCSCFDEDEYSDELYGFSLELVLIVIPAVLVSADFARNLLIGMSQCPLFASFI